MQSLRTRTCLGLAALASCTVLASGQTVVIPPANEHVDGALNVVTMLNNAARSFQWVIPGSDLALAPGANTIEGFRARTKTTGTRPSTTMLFSAYDVYIGELAIPLGAPLNPNFADNIVPGTEIQVRNGPLTVLVGSFPTGSSPNDWGPPIEFNLGAFPFDPAKDYAITVRHTGGGSGGFSLDANSNAGSYRGMFVADYTGTTSSSNANYTIVQLQLGSSTPACYANCDNSTTEPILNVDDFTCFINEFAAAQSLPHEQQLNHYANCDGSTTAPVLNVDDFTCFINEFAAGCP